MAPFTFTASTLFATSSKCRSVSIGSTSYSIGSSGETGKSLYSGRSPSVRTRQAKYSYALLAYKFWKEDDTLSVIGNSDLSELYFSYEDPYSDSSMKNKKFLLKLNAAGHWDIVSSQTFSPRTAAVVASVLAGIKMNFFASPYADDPLLFCDAVYYGFVSIYQNHLIFSETPDPTIEAQANRAFTSGLYFPLLGYAPFSVPDATSVPVTFNAQHDFSYYTEGKGFLEHEWSEEEILKIPPIEFLNDFVPTQNFFSIAQKMDFRLRKVIERMKEGMEGKNAIGKDYLNIRLTGNPGSGKTVLAYALSSALGVPVYTVPIQKNTEEDTFEGKNKLVDKEFNFVNTDFLNAYKNGGIIVLEEINLADPALIMGALGQAIEPPFIVNENGYKKITRHPLCVIIATQNVGTIGSRGVNQALVSRFKHTYVINDPTKEEFIERLMMCYNNRDDCEWVYNSYMTIKTWLCDAEQSAEDIALALSFRACAGVLEDIEEGLPRAIAIKKLHAIIYGESPEIAERALIIINSLPGM